MKLLRAELATVASAVLLASSCAVPPPPQVPDSPGDFHGVEAPPAGQSRIYFFRPPLSFTARKQDMPSGRVDGAQTFVLPHGSFTSIVIPPGRHVLSLIPGDQDASLWRSEFQFDLDTDRVYFVAIWLDLEVKEERQRSLVIPMVLPGVVFLHFIRLSDVALGAGQVRIEVVSEEDAKRGLYGARYVAPTTAATR